MKRLYIDFDGVILDTITPLYEAYTDIVALLRQNDMEKAKSILENSFPVEEKVAACIEKYQ